MYARRGGGQTQTQHVRAADFNSRLEKNRAGEAHNKQLQQYHYQNSRYDAAHQSDQRVQTMRRMQRFQRQNEELMTGYNIEQQAREETLKKTMAEQNSQMSAALYDIKAQKVAEETNVRRICEESEELKDLHGKLRAAKISRIRATQLAERDAIQVRDEQREAAMDERMDRDRVYANKREQHVQQEKATANMNAKAILQDQIAARQKHKKEAYESFLKEKAMVDEIVEGIEKEDRAKQAAMLSKQKELQHNIREFLEDRKIWRAAEKQKTEEELRKIHEYNLIQEERHRKMSAQKQKAADEQDEVLRKLTKEIEGKRREEEEMRALLDELYQEEAEQKGYEKEQLEIQKRARMKEDMIKANEYQMALKAKLAEDQNAEEEQFRQQMMQKFAEDTRLEQMNAMRRKREMENYKKEVERLVEERRKVFEESVRSELEELRAKQEQEAYRQAVIERERARLLSDYASDLQDHLPKGVLRNPNDFEVVYGRPPAFDEEKEERDLIASRNTGIAVGGSRNHDSRASMGRRSDSDYDSRSNSRAGSPYNGGGQGQGQGRRTPSNNGGGQGQGWGNNAGAGGNRSGQRSPGSGRFGDSASASNIFGQSPRGSRQGSRQGSSRNGTYENQKGPADRPF